MSPRCGWTSAWEDLMVALCLRLRRFWRLSINLCLGISGRCKSAMRKPQHHAKPDCGRVARSTTLLPSLPGSKTRNQALDLAAVADVLTVGNQSLRHRSTRSLSGSVLSRISAFNAYHYITSSSLDCENDTSHQDQRFHLHCQCILHS